MRYRVMAFAAAAGAAMLACAVVVPPLFGSGEPVWRYPQLPKGVARDLRQRGCSIVRGHNVIAADFTGSGERDWAVLCQRGDEASLFIYMHGVRRPSVFDTHSSGLVDDPEMARGIRVADWKYVQRHNPGLSPRQTPRPCVEDGVGMGSTLYCYLNGSWTALAGAD